MIPRNSKCRYCRPMNSMPSVVLLAAWSGLAACAGQTPPPTVATAPQTTTVTGSRGTSTAEGKAEDDGIIQVVGIPEPEAAPVDPVDAEEAAGLVCRKEIATGSHRVKKVCRTSAEIEQRRQADVEAIRQLQSRSIAPKPPG